MLVVVSTISALALIDLNKTKTNTFTNRKINVKII
jgi:hypothetical protein